MSIQNTWLTKNPFYLLGVSCTDNRRAIIAAADELGLMLDAEECSNAQNALLNPAKRLSAELDWFIDSDASATAEIRRYVQDSKIIPRSYEMKPVSGLNALLYNLPLQIGLPFMEIGFSIISIDKQFCAIDTTALATEISQNRELAKMSPVTEQDISFELDKKRGHIRQIIQDALRHLQDDEYVELIAVLSEYYRQEVDTSECTIISDAIDQYELRMQAKIDKATQGIENRIEEIKLLENNEEFRIKFPVLIARVRKWDKLVQPLQLKSMVSGMPHEISENLGHDLRELCIFLNNEKDMPEAALTLANALLEIFSEIKTLADRLKDDIATLQKLIREGKEAESLMKDMDALKEEGDRLKSNASDDTVTQFLQNLHRVNAKIKATKMEPALKTQGREALCYMAREVAIYLHNKKRKTKHAEKILAVLCGEFKDMPSLHKIVFEDFDTLMSISAQKKYALKADFTALLIRFGVWGALALFALIMINCG